MVLPEVNPYFCHRLIIVPDAVVDQVEENLFHLRFIHVDQRRCRVKVKYIFFGRHEGLPEIAQDVSQGKPLKVFDSHLCPVVGENTIHQVPDFRRGTVGNIHQFLTGFAELVPL